MPRRISSSRRAPGMWRRERPLCTALPSSRPKRCAALAAQAARKAHRAQPRAMLSTSACWSARCRLVGTDPRGPRRRSKRKRVRMKHNRPVVWPRRPNGMRRRASAARVLTKGRLSRPTGWMVRLLVLMLIAVPSLMITSPGYVAVADKLPHPSRVAPPHPEDTMIYATDGTTLLADLHPPGYQHYYDPLSDVETILPEAVISIQYRNSSQHPPL